MKPRETVIQIRVSRAEKLAIQRAAKKDGLDVSEWMRRAAVAEQKHRYEVWQGLTR